MSDMDKNGAKPDDETDRALADELADAEMPDETEDALERSLAVQGERDDTRCGKDEEE